MVLRTPRVHARKEEEKGHRPTLTTTSGFYLALYVSEINSG